MISRFLLDPEAFDAFPKNLLDDCQETARMAERIVRQIGFSEEEYEHQPPTSLSERLSWAIRAMEDTDSEE